MIYLIGSLRNPEVPKVAEKLREAGHEVFDEWAAAGPIADDSLRDYYKARGMNYKQALKGYASQHIFSFDKKHLERADTAVLVMPAGKSCFLELGWALGQGKKGYILMNEDPDRIDLMFQFATGIFYSVEDLIDELQRENPVTHPTSSFKQFLSNLWGYL